jgi:cobalt/nickel transport system permease protein
MSANCVVHSQQQSTQSASRVLAAFVALAALASESPGVIAPLAFYAMLWMALAWRWRVAFRQALRQPLTLTPLLAVLAVGLPLSRMLDRWLAGAPDAFHWTISDFQLSASLFLRAFLALTLLALLVRATGWDALVRALRRFGLPLGVTLTLTQMERYRQNISAEWRRTMQARESRSPGGHRFALASFAGQVGLVFLRSWERSERVHSAMLARGFVLEANLMASSSDVGVSPSGGAGPRWVWPAPLWLPLLAVGIRVASAALGGAIGGW